MRPTKTLDLNQDLDLITWYSEHKERFHSRGDHWSANDAARVAAACLGFRVSGTDLLRIVKLLCIKWPKSQFCGRQQSEVDDMVKAIKGPTPVWYPNAPTAKSDAKLEVKTEPVKETTPQPCLIEEVDRQRAIDNRFALLEDTLATIKREHVSFMESVNRRLEALFAKDQHNKRGNEKTDALAYQVEGIAKTPVTLESIVFGIQTERADNNKKAAEFVKAVNERLGVQRTDLESLLTDQSKLEARLDSLEDLKTTPTPETPVLTPGAPSY